MQKRIPRAGKIVLLVCAVLAIFWISLASSNRVRLATAKTYFRVQNVLIDRWPAEGGKSAIRRLTPVMCKIGVLRPVRMKVDPGVSFLLDPRDLVSVTILSTGTWQPEIWDAIAPVLSEGSVLLDVGAHIGYFSLKGSVKVGQTGRVVAFEPNPQTVALLRDNVAVNHAQNVIVEQIACTNREQMLTLYAAPSANTGASSLARENADISPGDAAPKPYSVRGRPIDDVVRELKLARVDAMKIDVEGAEVSVLRGAADTLKRFHPKVVIEVVPSQLASFNTTPEDVAAVLKDAGYNHSRAIDETDWEWTFLGANNTASTIRVADASTSSQLIHGFYNDEGNGWRWTGQTFAIELRKPEGANRSGAWLTLKFTIPEVSIKKLSSITVSAKIGRASLAPETFSTAGDHEYRREVPASVLNRDLVDIDFSLDKALGPNEADSRRLGVIVTSAGLELKSGAP